MFLQVPDPRQLKAILIDPDSGRAAMFAMALESRDITLTASVATASEALTAGPANLLFFQADHAEAVADDLGKLRAGLSAAVLVITERGTPADVEALMAAGADQVMSLGPQGDRLAIGVSAAIGAHECRRGQEAELLKSQAELAEAKLVYQAKAILIARHQITEAEAHRRVQKLSMERNIPISEMSRQIIDAENLLC